MINSVLPQDLSQCLVFNSPGLVRLQHRIKELEKEKAEQKRLYRYDKKYDLHLKFSFTQTIIKFISTCISCLGHPNLSCFIHLLGSIARLMCSSSATRKSRKTG